MRSRQAPHHHFSNWQWVTKCMLPPRPFDFGFLCFAFAPQAVMDTAAVAGVIIRAALVWGAHPGEAAYDALRGVKLMNSSPFIPRSAVSSLSRSTRMAPVFAINVGELGEGVRVHTAEEID